MNLPRMRPLPRMQAIKSRDLKILKLQSFVQRKEMNHKFKKKNYRQNQALKKMYFLHFFTADTTGAHEISSLKSGVSFHSFPSRLIINLVCLPAHLSVRPYKNLTEKSEKSSTLLSIPEIPGIRIRYFMLLF